MIITAEIAISAEEKAARELADHVKKATRGEMPMAAEPQRGAVQLAIYVGRTAFAKRQASMRPTGDRCGGPYGRQVEPDWLPNARDAVRGLLYVVQVTEAAGVERRLRRLGVRIAPEYVKGSDVAGFDIYPIFGSGYPSRLNWVADATEELVRIAGPQRPIYAWIETNKGSRWMTYSKQLDVEPKHTRCETWMAIIRGATAIGYFTHRWQPDYKQFAPEEEMVAELKRLNGQITRLAPAILATPAKPRIEMTLDGRLPCHFKATDCDGALYIFAQNIDLGPEPESKGQFEQITPRAGKATITVEGLKAGASIEVIDEHRIISAGDGKFTDDFAPLVEHIYRLEL